MRKASYHCNHLCKNTVCNTEEYHRYAKHRHAIQAIPPSIIHLLANTPESFLTVQVGPGKSEIVGQCASLLVKFSSWFSDVHLLCPHSVKSRESELSQKGTNPMVGTPLSSPNDLSQPLSPTLETTVSVFFMCTP